MSAMNIGIGLAILALAVAWRVLNWLWLRPKKLERLLREQGFKGNPYKSLTGDLKECVKMIKESKSRPIGLSDDPVPRIHPFVLQSVNTYAFGSSYEEGKRIFELQIEQLELAIQSMQTIYIPGWRFVPTKMNRRMKYLNEEVHSLLRGIISRREKSIRAGQTATVDLLGLLLESNMKEKQENRGNKYTGMSIQDVIEECKVFYFAGQETTSILLVWAMILLSIHPQWQDRAREEVLQVFGRDGKPDFDGLNHLKIVTMILYEVMRLYPPVTMINRFTRKEMKLGKLTIPAGLELSVPILLVHHDKEHWGEDAKEFKPERILSSSAPTLTICLLQ
ncbi:hypothetical protein CRG98_020678 [Punica granatum]|uniref:Cytochrome P450 CYP72A219-like n=1 Tax=Punica granatum TaxID=22663 RepID=A0A2I0JRM6_PUNGR|nr:hypothetical protein CRG98_020678 [Punica granatum]